MEFCGQIIPYNETVVSCHDLSITDITPVLELEGVRSLNLSRSGITHLDIIKHLSGLEYLHLKDTDIKDLTPLSTHKHLVFLNIAYTQVESILPLASLSNLSTVNVTGARLLEDKLATQNQLLDLQKTQPQLDFIGIEEI